MVAHVESIVKALGLPYRILRLCGGDMSFTSALTYDFEVYSEAQKRWLEVSSVSNFESFQANRLKLRYRDEEKKIQLAHTLNGSSLALPRIVAALLENYQTPEGIRIPDDLALIGFDNTYISQMSHPSVAAVSLPRFQLGYRACEVLSERIMNPASEEPRHFLLETELVLRDSI